MNDSFLGVKIDDKNQRLVWKPEELQENIFQIVATIQRYFGIRVKGNPTELEDGVYEWEYEVV